MFKSLRDRFRRASKKAEEELDPELKLDYESFRPEETLLPLLLML